MKIVSEHKILTPDDLDAVEARIGMSLPKDLRELYLRANGGIVLPDTFEKDGEYYTVHEIKPMIGPENGFERSFDILCRDNPDFPSDLVPFANDEGGHVFCYSLGKSSFGHVVIVQLTYFYDPSRFIVDLAPSLEAFLNGLIEDPDA